MGDPAVVWFDIPVRNFSTAKEFYGELMGWTFEATGDDYVMIKVEDESIGGFRKPQLSIRETECPIIYFSVDKLDPAVAKAKKLGANLVGERVEIGNDMGCYHWLRDKDGNLIGLWSNS